MRRSVVRCMILAVFSVVILSVGLDDVELPLLDAWKDAHDFDSIEKNVTTDRKFHKVDSSGEWTPFRYKTRAPRDFCQFDHLPVWSDIQYKSGCPDDLLNLEAYHVEFGEFASTEGANERPLVQISTSHYVSVVVRAPVQPIPPFSPRFYEQAFWSRPMDFAEVNAGRAFGNDQDWSTFAVKNAAELHAFVNTTELDERALDNDALLQCGDVIVGILRGPSVHCVVFRPELDRLGGRDSRECVYRGSLLVHDPGSYELTLALHSTRWSGFFEPILYKLDASFANVCRLKDKIKLDKMRGLPVVDDLESLYLPDTLPCKGVPWRILKDSPIRVLANDARPSRSRGGSGASLPTCTRLDHAGCWVHHSLLDASDHIGCRLDMEVRDDYVWSPYECCYRVVEPRNVPTARSLKVVFIGDSTIDELARVFASHLRCDLFSHITHLYMTNWGIYSRCFNHSAVSFVHGRNLAMPDAITKLADYRPDIVVLNDLAHTLTKESVSQYAKDLNTLIDMLQEHLDATIIFKLTAPVQVGFRMEREFYAYSAFSLGNEVARRIMLERNITILDSVKLSSARPELYSDGNHRRAPELKCSSELQCSDWCESAAAGRWLQFSPIAQDWVRPYNSAPNSLLHTELRMLEAFFSRLLVARDDMDDVHRPPHWVSVRAPADAVRGQLQPVLTTCNNVETFRNTAVVSSCADSDDSTTAPLCVTARCRGACGECTLRSDQAGVDTECPCHSSEDVQNNAVWGYWEAGAFSLPRRFLCCSNVLSQFDNASRVPSTDDRLDDRARWSWVSERRSCTKCPNLLKYAESLQLADESAAHPIVVVFVGLPSSPPQHMYLLAEALMLLIHAADALDWQRLADSLRKSADFAQCNARNMTVAPTAWFWHGHALYASLSHMTTASAAACDVDWNDLKVCQYWNRSKARRIFIVDERLRTFDVEAKYTAALDRRCAGPLVPAPNSSVSTAYVRTTPTPDDSSSHVATNTVDIFRPWFALQGDAQQNASYVYGHLVTEVLCSVLGD